MGRTFDGAADYLESASSAAVNVGAGDFTIMLWLKNTTLPDDAARLFNKGTSSGGSQSNPGVRYECYFATSPTPDDVVFSIDDNVDKREVALDIPGELTDGVWHLWIFERDAGTHLKIFIDGNSEKAVTLTGAVGSLDNGFSLGIMAGRGGDDTLQLNFPGSLADFVLVKRLLSGNEKDGVYKRGFRHLGTGGNPSLWLPIWGIHSPEIDLSPNGGSATVVSAPPRTNHPPIAPFSQRWWGSVPSAVVAAPAAGQDLTWQGGGMYLPPTEEIEVVAY